MESIFPVSLDSPEKIEYFSVELKVSYDDFFSDTVNFFSFIKVQLTKL